MIPRYAIRLYRFSLCVLMPKFALMLIKAIPVSLEIIFHHSFGERYFYRLIAGVLIFYAYATPSAELAKPATRPLLIPFLILLSVLSVVHFFHLPYRRRHGIVIASHSSGEPWFLWQQKFSLSPTVTIRYVEPAIAFLLGLLLASFDDDLGEWFKFTSMGLFIKGQIARYTLHQQILDTIDGRLDGQSQQNAVNNYQAPPRQHGFHHVHPHHERDEP